MNCNEAATLVAAYADGEIDGQRSAVLKQHLLGCANCAADCGKCPPVCGNGTCEVGEDCGSCSADCPTTSAIW